MQEVLSHSEKQLVLYSKGHFIHTSFIEDLRQITAKTFDIPLDSTHFYHLYDYVVKIFLKLHENKYIDETMDRFLCNLFKWNNTLKAEDVLLKMIGLISTVKAEGLNLGKPDIEYLPVYRGTS